MFSFPNYDDQLTTIVFVIASQVTMCSYIYANREITAEDSGYDKEEEEAPLEVGHNIFILAYKLSEHKRELKGGVGCQWVSFG